ncbi:MAG: TSCPD domain-containing protein [Deltaproteobacteria bacterium]|nr:MAG: TSCPD domain-containing protein [Deltaproteobacteria bacterium]
MFHTQGVCPPEIHFRLEGGVLREVRFVGGGCPGNAQLVSRFLEGKPMNEVLGLLEEIDCRNGTSCPDQLGKALRAVRDGAIEPARSFRVYDDPKTRSRIGLIGDLGGRNDMLQNVIQKMRGEEVEVIYCLGNLTGSSLNNEETLALIRKEGLLAVQGELDFRYSQRQEPDDFPSLDMKERDYLVRLPQVLSFQLGEKRGMAFFGQYLQDLPGFSDFEPFALEMNMVCDLTHFLQDETVFPALEAMVAQFEAQVILFSQIKKWGHWTIGGIDFISTGPAIRDNLLTWGMLEARGENIDFKIMKEPYSRTTKDP